MLLQACVVSPSLLSVRGRTQLSHARKVLYEMNNTPAPFYSLKQYISILRVWVFCPYCVCEVPRGQKMLSDPLELELRVVVGFHVDAVD